MNSPLHAWLDLPDNAGQAARLAAHLGVSKTAVSLWRASGVPLRHINRVAEFTGGKVRADDMVAHLLALRAVRPKVAA
jgi:DNA-binding transcriptional regulator YdaS (Cro superfamily)